MNHKDKIVIEKIVAELNIAEELLQEISIETFMLDEKTKRAVCMTVINIGELVKVVSKETRDNSAHIAWRAAAGFRDIAAHKYQTLNMDDVYTTVKQDFPEFRGQLLKLLSEEKDV
ncbi:MAG: DUF86 domain-containing protein [Roseburia sp.]|nr:DUF86 domain-containing protein [Roseburia sp.]